IDTATDITAVSAQVLSQFGLTPTARQTTRGVAGPHPVRLFEIRLSIPPVAPLRSSLLALPQLVVREWTSPPANIDALVGCDVLAHLSVILHGRRLEAPLGGWLRPSPLPLRQRAPSPRSPSRRSAGSRAPRSGTSASRGPAPAGAGSSRASRGCGPCSPPPR